MTDSADLSILPRTASRGVVADKRLVLVQMFDVARLTTHIVPLVPGTFVAVSGQGPDGDSNGSGKTSFLAAVSILLGDPQWRLDTHGGRWATGVLFRPASAGLHPAHDGPAATEGYVAGMFADPGDDTTTTVWVRLSTSAPYVQARWADGTHLSNADDDLQRDLDAHAIWQSIRHNGTLSARAMSAKLYGDAPRCLTYLDTPLRPSVPSLLSQQLTEMTPRDIGESLIALSGSKAHLDEERQQRSDVLDRERERDRSLEEHRARETQYETDLKQLDERTRARAEVAEALLTWQVYLALQYRKALDQDRVLEHDLAQAGRDVQDAQMRTEEAQRQLTESASGPDLQSAHDEAKDEWDAAKARRTELVRSKTKAETDHQRLVDERSALRPRTDGWDGRTVEEARSALDRTVTKLATCQAARTAAEETVRSVEERLARAERGVTDGSARAIALLHAAGISAAALVDVVEIDEEARTAWEPRLWPWRDAVVVDARHSADARRAVASAPGTFLILGDTAPGGFPTGVRASRPIAGYLNTLQERTTITESPSGTHDTGLDLWVSGDFDDPVTGRAAIVAGIQAELETAAEFLENCTTRVGLVQLEVESARRQVAAAEAAARLRELAVHEPGIVAALTSAALDLRQAEGDESRTEAVWVNSSRALASREADLRTLQFHLDQARQKEQRHRAALQKLQHDREALDVEAWRSCWAGDEGTAADLLDGNAEMAARGPTALRSKCLGAVRRAAARLNFGDGGDEPLPADVATATVLRDRLEETSADVPPPVDLDAVLAPVTTRLDGWADRDRGMAARIAADRERHRVVHAGIEDLLADGRSNLTVVQDMISRRIEAILQRVSAEFDRLDLLRGGCGAELHVVQERPDGAGEWEWHVTPRWRRSHTGGFVPYREAANGAQVKVYAIQLVLAALLSDADTRGRVLVLDELGNSLGEVNRKDVLRSLQRVAADKQVTILGTCQDSVVDDAADVCGELLWFEHSAVSDVYNQPTRVWGFDHDGERVELAGEWVTAGRRGW